LGLEDYGIFTLLTSTYLILDVLADFGTKMIGVRELAASNDRPKLLGKILILRLGLALLVTLVGLVFVGLNPLLENYKQVAIFALSMIFLTSLAGYVEMICQVRQRLVFKSLGEVLFSLLFFVWIIQVGTIGLLDVYMAYVVARIVSLAMVWGLLATNNPITLQKIPALELKKLLMLAVPMGLYNLLFTAYDRSVDTWTLGYFWGKDSVAVYGVAYKVYVNLVLPAYFFMNSVFPRLSAARGLEKQAVVKRIAPWLILGALFVIVVTWIGSPLLMAFMIPQAKEQATELLRILSITLFFSYLNHLFGYFVISVNQQKRLLFLGLIGLIVNVAGNLTFIPLFGVKAAAVVTILTEATMSLGLFIFFRKSK